MATLRQRTLENKTVYYIDYRISGKRHRKHVGTNRREAEAVLREIRRRLAARDPVMAAKERTKDVSIEDYFKEYLEHSEGRKSAKGHERDETIIRKLREGLEQKGVETLKEVTHVHLEKYLLNLKKQTSTENANRHLHTIKHAFNLAVDYGHLSESPAKRIKEFKEEAQSPPRFFTSEELDVVFWASRGISQEFFRAVYFLASTGVRRGELEKVTWNDIDLAGPTVRVQTLKKGKRYVTRTVPLTAGLADLLEQTRENGEPICDLTNVRRRLKKVVDRCGFPDANIHTLRHTYASHLVQRGVSLYVVSKLLGHSSIKTTEIYAHLAPSSYHEAVKLLPW